MSRTILQVFEDNQKSRMSFVQTIAELAVRPQNIDTLHSAGVIGLLKPLLMDSVPAIQQSAALAIGRLANHSEDLAESVIQNDIISQLIYSLSNQNRFFKIAKHSPQLSEDIVNSGALEPLVNCLEDFDATVKESSAWALGYIAKHNERLATHVKDAKAIEGLILCLKEPEISLKRCATQTLSYIVQHNEQLAIVLAENGIDMIVNLLSDHDVQLKRNVCLLLGNITKHSIKTSNLVIAALGKPTKLMWCLKDPDITVRKNASFCILEIVNKSNKSAEKFVNEGVVAALSDYITNVTGEPRLYGILSLGYIAHYEETNAKNIILHKKTIPQLRDALNSESLPQVKSAACFALGNIGKHTQQHASEVSEHNVLPLILFYYISSESTEDLKKKAKIALKHIIRSCNNLIAMEPLLPVAPKKIKKMILNQYLTCLKTSGNDRKSFLKNGGIPKLMEIKDKILSERESKETIGKTTNQLKDSHMQETYEKKESGLDKDILQTLDEIMSNFSEDIVKFYNKEEKRRQEDVFLKEFPDS